MDVANRYLVDSTTWQGQDLYYDNVYAAVDGDARAQFFATLPREFPRTHVTPEPWPGQEDCVQWLAALAVSDVWRIQHLRQRLYSGPKEASRIDFICVSESLRAAHASVVQYHLVSEGVTGDHMYTTLLLGTTHPSRGRGYWKLPKELLAMEVVVKAIQHEAELLLAQLPTAENRGRKHQANEAKHTARAARLRCDRVKQHHQEDDATLDDVNEAEREYKSSFQDIKHMRSEASYQETRNCNKRSSSHFFRAAQTEDGATFTLPADIEAGFRTRWSAVMRSDDYEAAAEQQVDEYLSVIDQH
ncbi:hypothetical protein ACHHYP_07671 [Achlya hypogyna]|uniref:Uncharacterized protein n=1 Tax=Achlya hypogyna TaxID=1202772 RepID=A0A1V9YQJ2_ACHHY|nr:hypothetical protein ACHHYP_07671 [Achlya hypogyna]